MELDGSFHLFGENLFSARVDGDRIAAMQFNHEICSESCSVARDDIANALYDWIGLLGLRFIVEVSERQTSTLGQPAQLFMTRLKDGAEVFGQNVVLRCIRERAGACRTASADL